MGERTKKRLVVKVGTNTLTGGEDRLSQAAMLGVARQIARLVRDFDLASHGWWPGQSPAVSARACFELVSLAGQTVDPALVHTWLRVLDREVAADVA